MKYLIFYLLVSFAPPAAAMDLFNLCRQMFDSLGWRSADFSDADFLTPEEARVFRFKGKSEEQIADTLRSEGYLVAYYDLMPHQDNAGPLDVEVVRKRSKMSEPDFSELVDFLKSEHPFFERHHVNKTGSLSYPALMQHFQVEKQDLVTRPFDQSPLIVLDWNRGSRLSLIFEYLQLLKLADSDEGNPSGKLGSLHSRQVEIYKRLNHPKEGATAQSWLEDRIHLHLLEQQMHFEMAKLAWETGKLLLRNPSAAGLNERDMSLTLMYVARQMRPFVSMKDNKDVEEVYLQARNLMDPVSLRGVRKLSVECQLFRMRALREVSDAIVWYFLPLAQLLKDHREYNFGPFEMIHLAKELGLLPTVGSVSK